MRHLTNIKSGKNLCEVITPHLTDNVVDTGSVLGREEDWCKQCVKWLPVFFSMIEAPRRKKMAESKLGRALLETK